MHVRKLVKRSNLLEKHVNEILQDLKKTENLQFNYKLIILLFLADKGYKK